MTKQNLSKSLIISHNPFDLNLSIGKHLLHYLKVGLRFYSSIIFT